MQCFVTFALSKTNLNGLLAKFQMAEENVLSETGKTLEMENAVILDDNSNRQPSKVNSLQDTGSKQQMEHNEDFASERLGDNDSITTVSPVCKDCYGSDGDNNDMFHDFWSYVLEFIQDHPHHDHSKQWETWMKNGLSQHSGLADVKRVMGIETISKTISDSQELTCNQHLLQSIMGSQYTVQSSNPNQ
jgi:hypothetical protein